MIDRDDPSNLRYVAGITHQAAALAWIAEEAAIRFMIVTSRRTARWVFPKGGIEDGMTAAEAAEQEAFEEAGVVGKAAQEPIGFYRIPKIRPPLVWTLEVALYPVRIDRINDDWMESHQRERRLVTVTEAKTLMDEPDLVDLATRFVELQSGMPS